jgi:arginyl-tRNA synthetase
LIKNIGRGRELKLKLINLQDRLRERIRAVAQEIFNVQLDKVQPEVPPRIELGDLAFPIAFELAKRIKEQTGEKRPPRAIAEEIKNALETFPEVARVEVAGAGYINLFYNRPKLLSELIETSFGTVSDKQLTTRSKIIVEHTNINPNKAAHIGHLRNAVLGDTFVKILRANGEHVEVQNYIDNTGVQVADVVVGFMHIEKMTLEEVKRVDQSLPQDQPFDYYCWDLYSRVGLFYRDGNVDGKENPEKLRLRADTLHAIEEGNNATAELAEYVATRIVHCHLNTMERLGIRYDVLPRESEILHLHFWNRAFEKLKEVKAIRFETEGKNAGCWVMPTDLHAGTDEHEADKILVRSNGTVTYTGKDIAYQLWKLGRLGLDFKYKPFRTYSDNHTVWVTTSEASTEPTPTFGNGQVVYNVIDSRQSYPQEVVRKGVAAADPSINEEASIHLSYEMVALSPAACVELGIELSEEDRKRPFIEMSGRKGLGVKADDLINQLERSALLEVEKRHKEVSSEEKNRTAHILAVSALRYFLLKWTRNTIIAFDFNEALATEGETGVYCLYAVVRANAIFRKLENDDLGLAIKSINEANEEEIKHLVSLFEGELGSSLWSLIMLAAKVDEAIIQAANNQEPAVLAKYTFQLARSFNLFYNTRENRIVEETDPIRRNLLIVIADLTRRSLTYALETLGINVPERM